MSEAPTFQSARTTIHQRRNNSALVAFNNLFNLTNNIDRTNSTNISSFITPRSRGTRSKTVTQLTCEFCSILICDRGLKAILLSNSKVELFSTDVPPHNVALLDEDFTTESCLCRLRNHACLQCGNVMGYHVTQPCTGCLDAKNNGKTI